MRHKGERKLGTKQANYQVSTRIKERVAFHQTDKALRNEAHRQYADKYAKPDQE